MALWITGAAKAGDQEGEKPLLNDVEGTVSGNDLQQLQGQAITRRPRFTPWLNSPLPWMASTNLLAMVVIFLVLQHSRHREQSIDGSYEAGFRTEAGT
jgi:hypothetical protein